MDFLDLNKTTDTGKDLAVENRMITSSCFKDIFKKRFRLQWMTLNRNLIVHLLNTLF